MLVELGWAVQAVRVPPVNMIVAVCGLVIKDPLDVVPKFSGDGLNVMAPTVDWLMLSNTRRASILPYPQVVFGTVPVKESARALFCSRRLTAAASSCGFISSISAIMPVTMGAAALPPPPMPYIPLPSWMHFKRKVAQYDFGL